MIQFTLIATIYYLLQWFPNFLGRGTLDALKKFRGTPRYRSSQNIGLAFIKVEKKTKTTRLTKIRENLD